MRDRNKNKTGYKKTKIGWIPKEWGIVHLHECSEIMFSNVDKKININEEPVMLCNYNDVYNNEIITNHIQFMKATATKLEIIKYSLQKGDVIITKDSETADDIGIPSNVNENLDHVLCGYHLALIRPDKKMLLGNYLSKLLRLHEYQYHFSKRANGITRFGLTTHVIQQLFIPLPPLSEQKEIVKILSAWDKAIDQIQKLINAKQRLKKGFIFKVLLGSLRFPEFIGHVSKNKAKDIHKKLSIGLIPIDWKTVKVFDLFYEVKKYSSDLQSYPLYSLTISRRLLCMRGLYS